MMFKNRRTIYFSKKKDLDIINYVKQFESQYDFSFIAKELMRDGLKYRKLQKSGRITEEYIQPNKMYDNVIQSNTPQNQPNFSEVKLEKKEINKDELESRLDDF